MKGLRIGMVLFAILMLSGCASMEGSGSGRKTPGSGMGSSGGSGGY